MSICFRRTRQLFIDVQEAGLDMLPLHFRNRFLFLPACLSLLYLPASAWAVRLIDQRVGSSVLRKPSNTSEKKIQLPRFGNVFRSLILGAIASLQKLPVLIGSATSRGFGSVTTTRAHSSEIRARRFRLHVQASY